MTLAADILVALVALLHLWFLVLEMFLWDKPLGRKTFRMTPEHAAATRTLAANQGLYNGFLAAGLLWGLVAGDPVKIFFLGCVVVAGVFGAFTVSRRIFWVQAAPALAALALLLFATPAVAQQVAKPNAILLVAKPGLADANFRETVVLVTQAPEQHTVGVILNRPTRRKVDKSGEPFYFGGPVMRQAMVALFRAERASESAFHVLKGVHLSMHPADVDPQKVRRGQRYRLYLGFSGWAPGQLEDEMRRDGWYVLPASEELLFRADTGGMWRELVDRAQKRKAPHVRGLRPGLQANAARAARFFVADATPWSGRFSVSFVTVHG